MRDVEAFFSSANAYSITARFCWYISKKNFRFLMYLKHLLMYLAEVPSDILLKFPAILLMFLGDTFSGSSGLSSKCELLRYLLAMSVLPVPHDWPSYVERMFCCRS